eukprot:symbB.v1.2.006065.t1/scaffold352.1/size221597/7
MGCGTCRRTSPEILTGWIVIVATAVSMALANLINVMSVEHLVNLKFYLVQKTVDSKGVVDGIVVLMALMAFWATLGSFLVQLVAPEAGGSGSAENKGWLNGFDTAKSFSARTIFVRFVAVIIFNTTGYPCGREGPTVTQGSGLAFLFCRCITSKQKSLKEYLDMRSGAPGAVRMGCIVGGACGMAMIFDSPLGGILYMFEEVGPACWPVELTFQAMVGCVICSSISYALLAMAHTSIRQFVIFEMWYGPSVPDYGWWDVPGFILLAWFCGMIAPLHTYLCVKVAAWRKRFHGETLSKWQPGAKIADAILFALFCAFLTGCVSLTSRCYPTATAKSQKGELNTVQFHCPEGTFNPVASLLLTTPEGTVKLLFNRDNFAMTGTASAIALVAYFSMNVLFTGVQVPTGNFTGTMVIGGMAGRVMGSLLFHLFPHVDFAPHGIYSMIGAVAVLASFKQMSLACVVFISGASNDWELTPALMMAVSISLFTSRCIACTRPWDEEQLIVKKVPYLPEDFCKELKSFVASDLLDVLPAEATCLTAFAEAAEVEEALKSCTAPYLPLLDHGRCTAVLGRPELSKLLRKEGLSGELLDVTKCGEAAGVQVLEATPAASLYPLFAQAHVQAVCVVTATGMFCGIISRAGLAAKTTAIELEAEEKGNGIEEENGSEMATESEESDEEK